MALAGSYTTMPRHLFTVEDTFTIRGRGTILVPGIVPEGDERFRIGDALRLRRPDGSEVEATIDGIECFTPRPASTRSWSRYRSQTYRLARRSGRHRLVANSAMQRTRLPAGR